MCVTLCVCVVNARGSNTHAQLPVVCVHPRILCVRGFFLTHTETTAVEETHTEMERVSVAAMLKRKLLMDQRDGITLPPAKEATVAKDEQTDPPSPARNKRVPLRRCRAKTHMPPYVPCWEETGQMAQPVQIPARTESVSAKLKRSSRANIQKQVSEKISEGSISPTSTSPPAQTTSPVSPAPAVSLAPPASPASTVPATDDQLMQLHKFNQQLKQQGIELPDFLKETLKDMGPLEDLEAPISLQESTVLLTSNISSFEA